MTGSQLWAVAITSLAGFACLGSVPGQWDVTLGVPEFRGAKI